MNRLLPYETIIKAHEGDPEAMNEVLSHYAGYIRYCSHIYGHFNVDMEDYIKTKLIESQFKFRLEKTALPSRKKSIILKISQKKFKGGFTHAGK